MRFPPQILSRLDGATFRQARADLEEFVGLGGIAISEETSPWAHAFTAGTITTADQASNALAAARTLASHTLPATDARVRQIGDDSALTTPATVEEWMERIDLLDGVAKTLAVFGPAVFDAPLQEMAASLAPGSGGPFRRLRARLGDGAYRSARKSALKLWTADKPRPETLHAAVVSAAGQLTSWRKAACGDSRPHVPSAWKPPRARSSSCGMSFRRWRDGRGARP